jgi:hypothetical protein
MQILKPGSALNYDPFVQLKINQSQQREIARQVEVRFSKMQQELTSLLFLISGGGGIASSRKGNLLDSKG